MRGGDGGAKNVAPYGRKILQEPTPWLLGVGGDPHMGFTQKFGIQRFRKEIRNFSFGS